LVRVGNSWATTAHRRRHSWGHCWREGARGIGGGRGQLRRRIGRHGGLVLVWVKHLVLVHDLSLLLFHIALSLGHTAGSILLTTRVRKLILDQTWSSITVVRVVTSIPITPVTRVASLVQITIIIHIDTWGFTDRERLCQLRFISPGLLLASAEISTRTVATDARLIVFGTTPGLMRVQGRGARVGSVPLDK